LRGISPPQQGASHDHAEEDGKRDKGGLRAHKR